MAVVERSQVPQGLFATPRRHSHVKRWEGTQQTTTAWDGLRRDPDLWFPDGDCLVYLYRQGTSQRGPSFRVPYCAVKAARCASWLLDGAEAPSSGRWSPVSASSTDDSEGGSPVSTTGKKELYIGPCGVTRQEVFDWHITTRNFFAWLLGKPLVGECLCSSLDGLFERLQLYRGPAIDNLQGLLDYAKDVGYLNFVNSPDHALAMLSFAEKHKTRDLFIDAFAHCVGMKDKLAASAEYTHVSRLTKALLSRAYLEMDIHVERATRSIGTFMEDELSSAYLGLSKSAREHLDDFRSFLQSYSIATYGYWPPNTDGYFAKSLYQEMHDEFRFLYEYLADKSCGSESTTKQPTVGGICVRQNLEAFNERHKYPTLPYALPLVPNLSMVESVSQARRVRRSLGFGTKNISSRKFDLVKDALYEATNLFDPETTSCPLVVAYANFEANHAGDLEDQVSIADARRVRWILVYAMVQMLSSINHAPAEVRDPEAASYPLCCLTIGLPPWTSASRLSISKMSIPATPLPVIAPLSRPPSPTISIHPDCENNDYFNYLPKTDSTSASATSNVSRSSTTDSKSSRLRRSVTAKAIPLRLSTSGLVRTHSQYTISRKDEHRRSSSATWSSNSSFRHSVCTTSSKDSLVLTMPALCWTEEESDDKEDVSGSEDEVFSPALEESGFFSKSFNPYTSSDLPARPTDGVKHDFDFGFDLSKPVTSSSTVERRTSLGTFLRYDSPGNLTRSGRI